MTPEAACFLSKARMLLLTAQEMLEDWPHEAGRAGYLAAFHAAQGLISERSGRIVRPHAEVQAQFGRLVSNDPDRGAGVHLFLARAYNVKVITDCEADPDAGITPDYAALTVERAGRLVEFVARSLMI